MQNKNDFLLFYHRIHKIHMRIFYLVAKVKNYRLGCSQSKFLVVILILPKRSEILKNFKS